MGPGPGRDFVRKCRTQKVSKYHGAKVQEKTEKKRKRKSLKTRSGKALDRGPKAGDAEALEKGATLGSRLHH